MSELEFVQNVPSIHLVIAEINDNSRFNAERLAAAYAINALTTEDHEFLFDNLDKHFNELIFRQAKFDEQKAMEICREIVNS